MQDHASFAPFDFDPDLQGTAKGKVGTALSHVMVYDSENERV